MLTQLDRDQQEQITAEAVVHATLRLVGEYPALVGRVRAARIISGRQIESQIDFSSFAVADDWPLKEAVALIDSLIEGGLVHRTTGPRPILVLTRAGHRALEAFDGFRSSHPPHLS